MGTVDENDENYRIIRVGVYTECTDIVNHDIFLTVSSRLAYALNGVMPYHNKRHYLTRLPITE